jgi:hypothetical protein
MMDWGGFVKSAGKWRSSLIMTLAKPLPTTRKCSGVTLTAFTGETTT